VKISAMKINSAAIEQGEWIGAKYDLPIPEMGDLNLKVRGIGNADFRVLQSRLYDATPRAQRPGGKLSAEASEHITVECLVETILVDWSGIEDDQGKAVPFNKDLARKMLSDRDLKPFRDAVMWASAQVGELKAVDGEAAAKN
jgi:hypothetical protein